MFVTLFALSAQADLLAIDHIDYGKEKSNPVATESYKAAVKAAKVEQKKARKLGFEWNTIKKLMKAAKKLHKKGDVKGSLKLVEEANKHGILGQRQAKDQENAGPNF